MESLSQDIAPAERRHVITVSASLLLLLINQMEAFFFFFKSGMHIGGIEVEKATFMCVYLCSGHSEVILPRLSTMLPAVSISTPALLLRPFFTAVPVRFIKK